jgi:hypothetical protein
VTTRDPDWLDQDRTEALAMLEYEASLCPNGCGQPLGESTTDEEHGPLYDVKRQTCRACAAALEARRESDDGGKGDNSARIWRIIRTHGGGD